MSRPEAGNELLDLPLNLASTNAIFFVLGLSIPTHFLAATSYRYMMRPLTLAGCFLPKSESQLRGR
ncbi:hypothetical protein BDN72DRAFT_844396 [Pluteus cervinus]|uniref:Uncharacterized protein n=1 Tax=Pluteus cervinus TaxID=181527 RepID=A0ACD3AKH9_9AGAR|nr:hypothetical protein BDN72DRAFT_844396 [Pluteus cervinus]